MTESGTAQHGVIDDGSWVGPWSLDVHGARSDLRAQGKWWRTGSYLVVAVLWGCALVLDFVGDDSIRWDHVVLHGLLVVIAAVLAYGGLMFRHQDCAVDARGVRLGRGIGRRSYVWSDIGSVGFARASEAVTHVVVSRQGQRQGRVVRGYVSVMADPVAELLQQEAEGRGIEVRRKEYKRLQPVPSPRVSDVAAQGAPSARAGGDLTDERYLGTWDLQPTAWNSRIRSRMRSRMRWAYLAALAIMVLIMLAEGLALHAKLRVFGLILVVLVLVGLPPLVWTWLTYRADLVATPTELSRTSFPPRRCDWGNVAGLNARTVATNTVELTIRPRRGSAFRVAAARPVAERVLDEASRRSIPVVVPAGSDLGAQLSR